MFRKLHALMFVFIPAIAAIIVALHLFAAPAAYAVDNVYGTLFCKDGNLIVTGLVGGSGRYDIVGNGPGLPISDVGPGSYTLPGPATWPLVDVEDHTNANNVDIHGPLTCTGIPIQAALSCDSLYDLEINITQGDGPFTITGSGPGLPFGNAVGLGTYTRTGPGAWQLTVTDSSGNQRLMGQQCGNLVDLTANAQCSGSDLVLNVAGDGPFNILGSGPGLSADGVAGSLTLTGPGSWTIDDVIESQGDLQSVNVGNFTCPMGNVNLYATETCSGDNLVVDVWDGDGPFSVMGAGPGLPMFQVDRGSQTLTGAPFGPNSWSDLKVTELGGDFQSFDLPALKCSASFNSLLSASAACNGNNLEVDILDGDGLFDITAGGTVYGGGLGSTFVPGPGSWTGVTVAETAGDLETVNLGNFSCDPSNIALNVTAVCNGAKLAVNISQGDGPFRITGSGPNLPGGTVGVGITNLVGPGTWTITVAETTGGHQTDQFGPTTCNQPQPFVAGASGQETQTVLICTGPANDQSCTTTTTTVTVPARPSGYEMHPITCDTPVYDSPGGSPVGQNHIANGQNWFVSLTPEIAPDGSSWTAVFTGGFQAGYVPTHCVSGLGSGQ